MFKFLFDLLVSPLGLPINPIYEYLIMLVVGELAYIISYTTVGNLIGEGMVPNKNFASAFHWIIRFIIYVLTWLILHYGITLYFIFVSKK